MEKIPKHFVPSFARKNIILNFNTKLNCEKYNIVIWS